MSDFLGGIFGLLLFLYIAYCMFWPIKEKPVIECKRHEWRVIDDSNWHNRICVCNRCGQKQSFKEPPNGVMFWD
jgi:hypothetical protein